MRERLGSALGSPGSPGSPKVDLSSLRLLKKSILRSRSRMSPKQTETPKLPATDGVAEVAEVAEVGERERKMQDTGKRSARINKTPTKSSSRHEHAFSTKPSKDHRLRNMQSRKQHKEIGMSYLRGQKTRSSARRKSMPPVSPFGPTSLPLHLPSPIRASSESPPVAPFVRSQLQDDSDLPIQCTKEMSQRQQRALIARRNSMPSSLPLPTSSSSSVSPRHRFAKLVRSGDPHAKREKDLLKFARRKEKGIAYLRGTWRHEETKIRNDQILDITPEPKPQKQKPPKLREPQPPKLRESKPSVSVGDDAKIIAILLEKSESDLDCDHPDGFISTEVLRYICRRWRFQLVFGDATTTSIMDVFERDLATASLTKDGQLVGTDTFARLLSKHATTLYEAARVALEFVREQCLGKGGDGNLESPASRDNLGVDDDTHTQILPHGVLSDYVTVARVGGVMCFVSVNDVLTVLPLTQVGPVNTKILEKIALKDIQSVGVAGVLCRCHVDCGTAERGTTDRGNMRGKAALDLVFDNMDHALDFCLECQSRIQSCMLPRVTLLEQAQPHAGQGLGGQDLALPLGTLLSKFVNN